MVLKLLLSENEWEYQCRLIMLYSDKNKGEKKGMIFWKPETETEQKLLELYAVEEEEVWVSESEDSMKKR